MTNPGGPGNPDEQSPGQPPQPPADQPAAQRRRAVSELRAMRGRYRLKGVTIAELVAEGRR